MLRSPRFSRVLGLLGLALFLFQGTATAQSAESVITQMVEQMNAQAERVDDYTVTTDDYVIYGRKNASDGTEAYETATRTSDGQPAAFLGSRMIGGLGVIPDAGDVEQFIAASEYVGTETIEGREAHVLRVSDPSQFDDGSDGAGSEALKEMHLYVDAERYVPLRMTMQIQQEGPMGTQEMNPVLTFSDYEETDGMMVARTTRIDMGLSDAMQQQMQALQQQMEQMPDARREQMEQMPQFQQMQIMMRGEPLVMNVREVQVNTGLDDDLF